MLKKMGLTTKRRIEDRPSAFQTSYRFVFVFIVFFFSPGISTSALFVVSFFVMYMWQSVVLLLHGTNQPASI